MRSCFSGQCDAAPARPWCGEGVGDLWAPSGLSTQAGVMALQVLQTHPKLERGAGAVLVCGACPGSKHCLPWGPRLVLCLVMVPGRVRDSCQCLLPGHGSFPQSGPGPAVPCCRCWALGFQSMRGSRWLCPAQVCTAPGLPDPRAGSGLLQEQGWLSRPTLDLECDQRGCMKPGLGVFHLIHSPTAGIECKRERIKTRREHVFS